MEQDNVTKSLSGNSEVKNLQELIRKCAGLSKREVEVLETFIEKDVETAKEAADILFVSKRTVDFHFGNIFDQLGVRARTRAVIIYDRYSRGEYSNKIASYLEGQGYDETQQ